MKVKDLIMKLYDFNQEAEITTPYSETIELSFICFDKDHNPIGSRETPIVFIEGCDFEQDVDDDC